MARKEGSETMADGRQFTVRQFAKQSRTTRDILHHYDKMGLLSPIRGENNYRYYSARQLAEVNLIRILQKSGMTLAEIKMLKEQLSPERMEERLTIQIEKTDKIIEEWIRTEKLLLTLQSSIKSALGIDEQAITIQYLHEEAIILGDMNDYSEGRNDYDALIRFHSTMSARYPDLDLNYPVWGLYAGEQIREGKWQYPARYYFYNPEGWDKRPAALYAIGYVHGGYCQGKGLYERMARYIDEHGFEICGDAYEEYPLNEVCIPDKTDYLIRTMITVREK